MPTSGKKRKSKKRAGGSKRRRRSRSSSSTATHIRKLHRASAGSPEHTADPEDLGSPEHKADLDHPGSPVCPSQPHEGQGITEGPRSLVSHSQPHAEESSVVDPEPQDEDVKSDSSCQRTEKYVRGHASSPARWSKQMKKMMLHFPGFVFRCPCLDAEHLIFHMGFSGQQVQRRGMFYTRVLRSLMCPAGQGLWHG